MTDALMAELSWDQENLNDFLRVQVSAAMLNGAPEEARPPSKKGEECRSIDVQDTYGRTLSVVAENLQRSRQGDETSSVYARRKAAAKRQQDEWKDRVALQRWRNHDIRERGGSRVPDQGIAFNLEGQPYDSKESRGRRPTKSEEAPSPRLFVRQSSKRGRGSSDDDSSDDGDDDDGSSPSSETSTTFEDRQRSRRSDSSSE